MLIECSFCSTAKSERYLYTECGHFVCINCAALRASENLECCSIMTQLDQAVKVLLRDKKDKIMSNLQNQYKYERTDVNKIGLIQLEERLKKIDNMQNRPSGNYQKEDEPEITQPEDEQLKETPMDQFYRSPLILEQHYYQVPQSSPIKMVSHPDEDDQDEIKNPHRNTFNPLSQQKLQNTQKQPIKRRDCQLQNNQLNSTLEKSVRSVRQSFKGMYEQLQKLQANIVYQMKIYFEEYINLIQKENSQFSPSQFVLIETERINNFLHQFVQEWNLQDITHLLNEKEKQITFNFIKEPKSSDSDIIDKRKIIYFNPFQPLQSCRINQPINQKNDIKDGFLDKLRLSQCNQTEKKVEPSTVTGRNLDRIYKKLEQSRSKLQERIQIHNEFMSRRCIKLSSY